jgi:hypothetical protein
VHVLVAADVLGFLENAFAINAFENRQPQSPQLRRGIPNPIFSPPCSRRTAWKEGSIVFSKVNLDVTPCQD